MGSYHIALLPGDGAGVEVVDEGIKALNAAARRAGNLKFHYVRFGWGSEHYRKHGRMMPEDAIEQLSKFDVIYLGAVGWPDIQDHVTLNGLLLPIRRAFDQYVNERPAVLFEGVASPLAGKKAGEIDLVVMRENTEGEYSNVGGRVYQGSDHEVAIQTSVFTRRGTERIIRYAFEAARQRNKKKKVTSITKSNAQGYGMVFWDEVFRDVAEAYPDIETESKLIDAACMDFIRKPESFDVVVASNLFGDILTDISAILIGSMGLAASANIDPSRRHPSMFEPVHGSAPDIAGKGIVNPLAAILSAGMMLDFMGEKRAAGLIDRAIRQNLREEKVRTPDIGGRSKTAEVGDDICRLIEEVDLS
ncbi:MAG: tartrate dehydrogenase [Candidatus Latescibacteria bacterium]|nr:tartrate dehydrogenase [Candidatus Latescibacterota bacterium]